jgi:hypothetical protein
MAGTGFDADFDPQDQAETLDESMTVGGEGSVGLGGDSPLAIGEDMRTFEELPDVLDVTQVAGDRDDDQDGAEAFDETNLDEHEEINEMRTFEELPDVLDVTSAEGDRDDDEALALDADEFDEDAIDDDDLEEDNELDYRAATQDREDDIDGLGDEDSYDDDQLDMAEEVEGLDEEVGDADTVTGGEDDFTNFQAKAVADEDLKRMGYSEDRGGETRAKPDED